MNKPVHVLHLITAFDRGGAENHLSELVRHQRAAGMEVTIAYLRGRGAWGPAMRELGVEVVPLGLRFYGDLRPLWRLRRLIAKGKPSLVHAHLPPAELYARVALLGIPASSLPLIISKHNDCPFHRIPGESVVERWVDKRAAAVIAISEAVAQFMERRGVGTAPGQMETIFYGIDIGAYGRVPAAEIADLRDQWGAERDTLLIGFVGRLVPQKSIETLIHAFALLRRKTRCDAKLVIVGSGPLQSALRSFARNEGVSDRVVWAGFHENIPAVMRAFDVFALTSLFEGFGLVLIEAMAARKPVVATRVSAIPEVVVDGETGLLAEVKSAKSVAEALERLLDPAMRERLGSAGGRRAFEHFTLERMCQATDAVYSRCLGVPVEELAAREMAAAH
jgi:glycosyltransferase involved in cell wall biosynthesis